MILTHSLAHPLALFAHFIVIYPLYYYPLYYYPRDSFTKIKHEWKLFRTEELTGKRSNGGDASFI